MTNDDEWTAAGEQPSEWPTKARGSEAPTESVSSQDPTPAPDSGPAVRPHKSAVTKQAPSRRNTKRWVTIGLVAALVLAVVGLGGSELYLRHQVTSCLSKAFASITGAPTKVSLSGKPMLLQAWSKEIPFVQVNSTGDGDSEGELDLRVEDIRSTGEASTIGKITGTGYVPFDQVVKSAQEGGGMLGSPPGGAGDPGGAGGPGQIERISGNADGTFDVATTVTAVIIPVPVTVTLRPGVRDGKAYFEVVRADVVGFGIPPDFAQNIVDEVTTATFGSTMRNLSLSKLGMRGSGGIEFAVNGSDITVDENLVRPRTDCAEVTTAAG